MYVEVRELLGISSLFTIGSEDQTQVVGFGWQATLPAEPSCQILNVINFNDLHVTFIQ